MNEAEVYTSLLQHFARYFDACDRADLDAVMDILAGTTLNVGGFETADPVVVRQAYESRQPVPEPDGRRRTKHHVTNLVAERAEHSGEVVASAYYFRLEPGDAGPLVAASGRLEQVLVRDGERWRVRRHAIISDF